MSNLASFVRWICVFPAAGMSFVAAFTLFALWKPFGEDPTTTSAMSILFGTFFGVLIGTLIAGRQHWRIATVMLAALAVLFPTWLVIEAIWSGTLQAGNFLEVVGALAGSLMAFHVLRHASAGRKIKRVPD